MLHRAATWLNSKWPWAMRKIDVALSGYNTAYARHPYGVAFLTCFVKGGAADLVTQSVEGRPGFDGRRNLAFAAFSGGYLGCGQHWIFNLLYPWLFDGLTRRKAAICKVLFDNFVHLPFCYFPLYYMSQPVMKRTGTARQGLENYKTHMWDTCTSGCTIWLPVSTINFYLIPQNFRIAWMAAFSFGWLTILSFISNRSLPGTAKQSHEG